MELCIGSTRNLEVSGRERYKYFGNALSGSNHRYILAIEHDSPRVEISTPDKEPIKNNYKSFKNSSSQTNRTKLKEDDEYRGDIVELRQFSFSNNARDEDLLKSNLKSERDKLEALLPPIMDEASFLIHKKFHEEQNRKEFEAREDLMRTQVTEKIKCYKSLLQARNKKREELALQRIDNLRKKKCSKDDSDMNQPAIMSETETSPLPIQHHKCERFSSHVLTTMRTKTVFPAKTQLSKRKRERYKADLNIMKESIESSVSQRKNKLSQLNKVLEKASMKRDLQCT